MDALFHGLAPELEELADEPVWRLRDDWHAASFRGLYQGIPTQALTGP